MTSPEMHTLAGAYALDALDELERARFARHLEECPSCTQEVRELRATAVRLGAAVAEEPPAELKERVLAAARATRQEPPATGGEPGERSRSGRGVPRWALVVAAAAAVVGLAAGGIFGGLALDTQRRLDVAQERIDEARAKYAPMGELLAAPDVLTAHGTGPAGRGTVIMSPSLDKAVFMASGLPERTATTDYQVWLLHSDGSVRSLGLVPGGPDQGQLLLAQGLAGVSGIGVTVEPRGGSPAPTTLPPVLTVPMTV